eukprot:TRINITY_DN759_c1_g1_i1.p2 TRINITY_DN759_c1_g1~~TRINITY_DN759_c1_g1_i1.p2  ORF type:complete len:130 (+),score=47.32 TRINITY_DN759_c1_g1_i1:24-413(+)
MLRRSKRLFTSLYNCEWRRAPTIPQLCRRSFFASSFLSQRCGSVIEYVVQMEEIKEGLLKQQQEEFQKEQPQQQQSNYSKPIRTGMSEGAQKNPVSSICTSSSSSSSSSFSCSSSSVSSTSSSGLPSSG